MNQPNVLTLDGTLDAIEDCANNIHRARSAAATFASEKKVKHAEAQLDLILHMAYVIKLHAEHCQHLLVNQPTEEPRPCLLP